MKRFTKMKCLFALFLLAPLSALAKPSVVATTSDLGSIAREVGGDDVEVTVLARPTQDPHFVDAKPSLVLTLSRAEALLLTGLDLEVGWLPVLITSSRNPKVQRGAPGYLDCSTLVTLLEVPTQKIDRSMGDVHAGGNPHYAKDPRNGALLARGIAERLAQLFPDKAAGFRERATRLEMELKAKLAGWEAALKPFAGTPLITYHRSWIYFTRWTGLREVGQVEPKPGLQPSAGHVAQVLQTVRAEKVPAILQEDWYAASTSELIARNGGAKLLRVPGMPGDRQRYVDYVQQLVDALLSGLKR
jgi:zinc/manganese transport system substrate-binding protein